MSRCTWVDTQGVRCPAPGTQSRSTNGSGRLLCVAHAHCRNKRDGDAIVNAYVERGEDQALSAGERATVQRRLAGVTERPRGVVLDAPRIAARKREADKRRAVDVYEAAVTGCQAAGMDPARAHEEALAHVYRVAESRRLHLPPPKLTPADRRAGAGAGDER
jgi:hypothetical protein